MLGYDQYFGGICCILSRKAFSSQTSAISYHNIRHHISGDNFPFKAPLSKPDLIILEEKNMSSATTVTVSENDLAIIFNKTCNVRIKRY
jgi:hypothetical protein